MPIDFLPESSGPQVLICKLVPIDFDLKKHKLVRVHRLQICKLVPIDLHRRSTSLSGSTGLQICKSFGKLVPIDFHPVRLIPSRTRNASQKKKVTL